MHPGKSRLVRPTAALSLLAGCLIEATPEPPPPPPPVELALMGRLVDASGAAAPFVPVRLGLVGGPIVATDEAGSFVFPDLPAGEHTVYAHDELDDRVGFATIAASAEDDVTTVALQPCNELLTGIESTPNEVINLCFGVDPVDLPPFERAVTFDALELVDGTGFTNSANTGTSHQATGDLRRVNFSMHDGLARGGVREFTFKDHRLVGAEPGSDPFSEPVFSILLRDRNGGQYYTVRDGSFRLEVSEEGEADRAYVVTGTDLLLDYGEPFSEYDLEYTLTVPSVRLEGTLEVELPPLAPAGDVTSDLSNAVAFTEYDSARNVVAIQAFGSAPQIILSLELDLAQLALPGSFDVELPIDEVPDLGSSSIYLVSPDGSAWDFDLLSYTVTTSMTEAPGCGSAFAVTLENLVFRFVAWDYDENSDRVESFGEQTLTIEDVEVSTPKLIDLDVPDCS